MLAGAVRVSNYFFFFRSKTTCKLVGPCCLLSSDVTKQSTLSVSFRTHTDKRSSFPGNKDHMKALRTYPPQELICFRWER